MKTYDYFTGAGWTSVTEEWLDGVKLDGLKEVFKVYNDTIKCVYKDGNEVYYHDIFGTWGSPTVFR